ncbi:MAG TPA: N-formylglutamate amidohydrolase [Acetobacteraceae bacterium]|nr:N-formylglutamate amidohydrolase [Acetobacteraceae bacterium]
MGEAPFGVENIDSAGQVVIICDHASNRIPESWGDLGLPPAARETHIAWDPGALAVSRRLAARLGAPLIFSTVSRLVIDMNRPLGSPTLIPAISETTPIPGNANLTAADRRHRIETIYRPYHAAIDQLIGKVAAERTKTGLLPPSVVAIHSFTPVFKGVRRPWQVGVIHDADNRLSSLVLARLSADPTLSVAENEPYVPAEEVYFTLEQHALGRGLMNVMIEIRNDEVQTCESQDAWAGRLAEAIAGAVNLASVNGHDEASRPAAAINRTAEKTPKALQEGGHGATTVGNGEDSNPHP